MLPSCHACHLAGGCRGLWRLRFGFACGLELDSGLDSDAGDRGTGGNDTLVLLVLVLLSPLSLLTILLSVLLLLLLLLLQLLLLVFGVGCGILSYSCWCCCGLGFDCTWTCCSPTPWRAKCLQTLRMPFLGFFVCTDPRLPGV